MRENSKVDINWYGERGIVNALVMALQNPDLKAVQSLLNTIVWADGTQRPQWIKQIKSVSIIVEVSLGQFGDPDLILVCKTTGNITYTIFVEAKTEPYLLSAERGGGSRIHRQLTLKYRFAFALQQTQIGPRIIESQDMHSHYQRGAEDSDLSDHSRLPRQLAKKSVLELCRSAGIFKTELENFRFVAWTWDREPFFNVEGFEKYRFRPLFLQNEGQEEWNQTKMQLGWLGYSELFKQEPFKNDAQLNQAFETMLSTKEPAIPQSMDCQGKNLRSININQKCNSDIKQQLSTLESIAEQYYGTDKISREAGSTSLTLESPASGRPKVLIKLVPQESEQQNQLIKLGISTSLNRKDWADQKFAEPVCIGGQPFYTLDLTTDEDGIMIASQVFEEVAEMLDNHRSGEDT